jgi:hypothetical protein
MVIGAVRTARGVERAVAAMAPGARQGASSPGTVFALEYRSGSNPDTETVRVARVETVCARHAGARTIVLRGLPVARRARSAG